MIQILMFCLTFRIYVTLKGTYYLSNFYDLAITIYYLLPLPRPDSLFPAQISLRCAKKWRACRWARQLTGSPWNDWTGAHQYPSRRACAEEKGGDKIAGR